MSRAANPTRPTAGTAEVRQRLAGLTNTKRKRLEDWGYPIAKLDEWAARGDAKADEVDALLAILLNRPDYTYDLRDVRAGEIIARKLGADTTPRAHLMSRGAVFHGGNIRGYLRPGEKSLSMKGVFGILGGTILLIVLGGVVVAFLR